MMLLSASVLIPVAPYARTLFAKAMKRGASAG
jgi:hypothetical protein